MSWPSLSKTIPVDQCALKLKHSRPRAPGLDALKEAR